MFGQSRAFRTGTGRGAPRMPLSFHAA